MSPTPIQAGENWWFPRGFAEAIEAGASDFIMPDVMKCGGVTGWLQVAAQASAANIPMSSHCSRKPAPNARGDANRALAGISRFRQRDPRQACQDRRRRGHRARPGLGLEWNESAVAKYLVT